MEFTSNFSQDKRKMTPWKPVVLGKDEDFDRSCPNLSPDTVTFVYLPPIRLLRRHAGCRAQWLALYECPLLTYSCSFPRNRLLFAHLQKNPFSKGKIIDFPSSSSSSSSPLSTRTFPARAAALSVSNHHKYCGSCVPTIPPALSVDRAQSSMFMEF